MKNKSEILRDLLNLAKRELNTNGNIGYTMPDGKYHVFIYVDGDGGPDGPFYVIEPNKVVDGAHEPMGETTAADYNDFAELLVGCQWCIEEFERDREREQNIALSVDNNSFLYVLNTRDFESLKSHLSLDSLKVIDNILDAYYHNKIDINIPPDGNGNFNFEDVSFSIRDFAYKETGFELLVLKWIENMEDTGYLIDCFEDVQKEIKTYTVIVDYLKDKQETSFEFSFSGEEKPESQWLADQIYAELSAKYSGQMYFDALNSIYCIEMQVTQNGEYVDQDEISGGDIKPLIEKVKNPFASSVVHKGDAILFDGSFKFWSNSCGDLHRNGNEWIKEDALPEPLQRAYKELWGEGYSSLCYLVETPDGYGVALINEYDDYTASVKECSKEELFELVKTDKERVMASPGFENAKVYAGDYTGFEKCHELVVFFPADIPFDEFDSAAKALEYIAYNSYFDRAQKSSLDEQISAAQTSERSEDVSGQAKDREEYCMD